VTLGTLAAYIGFTVRVTTWRNDIRKVRVLNYTMSGMSEVGGYSLSLVSPVCVRVRVYRRSSIVLRTRCVRADWVRVQVRYMRGTAQCDTY
jgi:hypothetical protein